MSARPVEMLPSVANPAAVATVVSAGLAPPSPPSPSGAEPSAEASPPSPSGAEVSAPSGAEASAPPVGPAARVNVAEATDESIWTPQPGATWQWQLTGEVDTSFDVEMYDIDLFTSSTTLIEQLHADGRVVICYFSAGSYEPDRPDSSTLESTGLGSALDGWPDERWVDIRSEAVREVMTGRLDFAVSQGCDGVEPDNVDAFDNDNGLDLTAEDQLDFNLFLAEEAHARGLSIGLKNTLALIPNLVEAFDWALNEECVQFEECAALAPFLEAGKAVFHCEYGDPETSEVCEARPPGFSTIIKSLDLDAPLASCN